MPAISAEVKRHNEAVQRRGKERVCYRKVCGGCGEKGPFAPHDVRDRELRVIVANEVHRCRVWLARWHCPHCAKRFTDFPFFRFAL